MLKLIKNIRIFRDGDWKSSELLIADKRIAAVGDKIDCAFDGLEVIDGKGMRAIPGYIDQHVHITGGGGEGGFSNQVPPLKFSAPVKAGITTIVGLLGTDGTTRSVESLVAKAKAFREQGLTCYCLTGAYQYPSPNVTGSVRRDIVMLEECIGVKIAICDHRSATITRDELMILVRLLCPFAPHLSEELWETLGGEGLCSLAPWPVWDENKTVDSTVEVAVQINGKLRGTVQLPLNCPKEDAIATAKADAKIAAAIEGKTVVKEISIPNKIINIVVR